MTREQFTYHIECNQRALRRFLVALCSGDTALADDIAQEACIKAWLSCDNLEQPDKFQAWLMRIAYTTFISHCRNRRPTASYEQAATEMSHLTSDESADNRFRYQALYMALEKLSDKERTSVLLYYIQGYSIREIAGIVDASESAVKQHLTRGRTHLRHLIINRTKPSKQ